MWLRKELVIFMRNFSFIHANDSGKQFSQGTRGLTRLLKMANLLENREKINLPIRRLA